jgi:glycosyltransferase involved in cell wall biosynthesis
MTITGDRTHTERGALPARTGPTRPEDNGYAVPVNPAKNLRVSVVIPARNEAKSLPHVLPRLPSWVHEVILVDGLSVDDTSAVAKLEMPAIRIVEQTGRGKGNALREGFINCTGDVVVAIDADGSMDPLEMDRYVELIAMGFDYVKGSRMLPGGSSEDLTGIRRIGNWIFRTLTNLMTGSRYSDLCYGYFAFRRGTIDELELMGDGFEIETEINIRAHRAGLRIAEVPSVESDRRHGESQLNAFKDGLRILLTIFRTSLGRQEPIESLASPNMSSSIATDGVVPATASVVIQPLVTPEDHNGVAAAEYQQTADRMSD